MVSLESSRQAPSNASDEPLEARYTRIRDRVATQSDFVEADIARSRALFLLDDGPPATITPRGFDVWTILAGLPLPKPITTRLNEFVARVALLLSGFRLYRVKPENYHWEVFIVQRPPEQLPANQRAELAPAAIRSVISLANPFSLSFRGFLVTPDGTILAQGYGPIDSLRRNLRSALPFASPIQSNLGHVSLGRILDPIGPEAFITLQGLVAESQDTVVGSVQVEEVKYVHEEQWYMEDYTVVETFPLGKQLPSVM